MSSEISLNEKVIEVLYESSEEISSGEEQPMSEWSSLEEQNVGETENPKKVLYEQGLYSPGSSDICNDYISMSDSTILRHLYYNYPAVTDPGIVQALLVPETPIIYPDDGQKLYLQICSEMNICPVRMFYTNLLSPVNSISYYGVNPRGVRAMAMALQNNKIVTCFDLTDNFLNDDACYHLGEMIKTNTTLQELILEGCRIGMSGLMCLGENLFLNHTLESLNLARNEIGDNGGVVFAKQVYTGASIKKVNVSKNNLGQKTAIALIEGLEWKNPFTHLDLSWNNFTHIPTAVKMFEQLALSDQIQELYLSFNAFDGERVAGAINSLLRIPTLTVLDLSHNRIQGEALNIITSGLIYAKELITFNLSYNPMSPEDAFNTLQKMLRPRVKLQQLLMESIPVDKSFLALLDRVLEMKNRKNFSVTYGHILQNWTVEEPDIRHIVLKRADYECNLNKKTRVDIAQYFLTLNKQYPDPVPLNFLTDKLIADNIPLSEGLVTELANAFAGPKTKKSRFVNIYLIAEYMERIWPDRKLPPTPPVEPEPEPEPEEEAAPLKKKGKKGKK